MAYFSQEMKKELAPAVNAVLKKYGVKATLAVHNHLSFVVNIKSSKHDFLGVFQACNDEEAERRGIKKCNIGTYLQISEYHVADQMRSQGREDLACFFEELISAMKGNRWFDKSDIQSDYFHIAYYLDINIGKWNKPYELIK
jgi:hypothetical protein